MLGCVFYGSVSMYCSFCDFLILGAGLNLNNLSEFWGPPQTNSLAILEDQLLEGYYEVSELKQHSVELSDYQALL
jgi:hypothetical protein